MNSTIFVTDRDISFAYTPGERVLDAAERAGYTMPYSCRKGVCETCSCRLTRGTVVMAPSGSPRSAGDTILSCMALAEGEIEIEPRWIEKRAPLSRIRVKTTVYDIVARSPSVALLHLRLPIGQRVHFNAGQYVSVQTLNGQSRNYSIANAPHLSDMIQLHVRRVPGGQFSDETLNTLSPGGTLDLELPYGLFGWTRHDTRPAILLATGTGFAPLKSMVEDLIHRGTRRAVHLFWGADRADDVYDAALVREWSDTLPWFRFTAVLAQPDNDWRGAVGFVQNEVAKCFSNLAGHEVYACGNPLMIRQARLLLVDERGLSAEDFFSDAFLSSAEPVRIDAHLEVESSKRRFAAGGDYSRNYGG